MLELTDGVQDRSRDCLAVDRDGSSHGLGGRVVGREGHERRTSSVRLVALGNLRPTDPPDDVRRRALAAQKLHRLQDCKHMRTSDDWTVLLITDKCSSRSWLRSS